MNKILKLAMLYIGIAMCITNTVQAEIHSEVVEYLVDGQPFQGYLSYDDAITGKRPGVLVVHEWWGHTPMPENVQTCWQSWDIQLLR